MSNLDKARAVANEWIDLMGGLDNISYIYGNDIGILVQAIHAAGLLMPDLPEPDVVKLNGDVKYFTCYGVQVRQDADDDHVQMYSKRLLTANESRRLALALLAAANYAEKEKENE